jgi:hypothetical protein
MELFVILVHPYLINYFEEYILDYYVPKPKEEEQERKESQTFSFEKKFQN